MSYRIAVDTGGTFTDLVLEAPDGQVSFFKSPTTPADPVEGLLSAVALAAEGTGMSRSDLLGRTSMFIHATTRALNALVTGTVARTALLTTAGHPDILLFREGGRRGRFDTTEEYPRPLVPRSLTFQVAERIAADGSVVRELDEAALVHDLERMRELGVEAVGVCLLWSVVNGAHEKRVGELIAEHLPGTPFTLSHELNPILREYRRASSTVIDASLKPLMSAYLDQLQDRLADAGFRGRALIVTSSGGVDEASAVARQPVHAIGSGPAMAPVAGRHFADVDCASGSAIVADAGGTTYDISLIRGGTVPRTQEAVVRTEHSDSITGFPSVEVRSVGAGGGSIAWIDNGGMLHVGPRSAGAVPGPAAYGKGGDAPTVTDAALVLGYIDPEYFLGGSISLKVERACAVIERDIARPLRCSLDEAAAAIMRIATENMVAAIEDLTLMQGVDPQAAPLIAGGGAAGLNAVAIADLLGSPVVVLPETGPALSAVGALMSELSAEAAATHFTTSADFDREGVSGVLGKLRERAEQFVAGPGHGATSSTIEFVVEARYPHQVWELPVPVPGGAVADAGAVAGLEEAFHALHAEVFAINDPGSAVEFVTWRVRPACRLTEPRTPVVRPVAARAHSAREVYFPTIGRVMCDVLDFAALPVGEQVKGPAIVSSATTTVVIDPDARYERSAAGSLLVVPPHRWA